MPTPALAIDPKSSALLVMDYQTGVVDLVPTDKEALLARTASLLAAARTAGIRIFYVVVGFRPGYPEIGASNPTFGAIRGTGRFVEGAPGSEVHPAVAPAAGEVVVTKRRVSAFAGSDLEVLLRAGGITTLVLAGIATSGVVLSTVRQAADGDYALVVVEDCCADRDAEVHRVLMDKVLARQATVVKAEVAVAAMAR